MSELTNVSCLSSLIHKDFRAFQFVSLDDDQFAFYKHDQLNHGVEKWIKILKDLDLAENPKIGIIHELNFEYICIIFAAISIGANFVILDTRFDENSKHKIFLPLDVVIYDYTIDIKCDDLSYWDHGTQHLIDARLISKTSIYDVSTVDVVNANFKFDLSQTNILSATTSGTTGPVSPIAHSYQYLLDISQRNSKILDFSGRVAHLRNLYHGSSLPVFYLPSMIDSNFHFCIPWINEQGDNQELDLYLKSMTIQSELLGINHILFPYDYMIKKFLQSVSKSNLIFDNLKIYTLSYINEEYKSLIKDRNIEIVSIFGCTETSGPIMINTLSTANLDTFDPSIFHTVDDFFELTLLPNGTQVRSKNGLVDHFMHDIFEKIDDTHYKHMGRSNFYRVNETIIDSIKINNILDHLKIDGNIVVDSESQAIYLALWDHSDAATMVTLVNQELSTAFDNNRLQVTKCSNLNKFDFMSGIKLNLEIVKKFFRSNGEENV
jgi:hypothetical protein